MLQIKKLVQTHPFYYLKAHAKSSRYVMQFEGLDTGVSIRRWLSTLPSSSNMVMSVLGQKEKSIDIQSVQA